jgi:hypothetical protein
MTGNYKIMNVEDGVPRAVAASNPEAVAFLIREGLTSDVFDKAKKMHEKWTESEAKKQRQSKLEHEKAQAEKHKPINQFLSAIRHHRNFPELLWSLEETLTLEDLKEIERGLPTRGMPRDLIEYARDWITVRIAGKQ